MSAMFLAMVWHARRRQEALRTVERRQAEERASLLEQQKRFLHDVSHELRTPVTIARGHLEVLQRTTRAGARRSTSRSTSSRASSASSSGSCSSPRLITPTSSSSVDIDVESFLEDVFMRWSEVAPRAWRLGPLPAGSLRADPEALRIALDALLENAVKYTDSLGCDRAPRAGDGRDDRARGRRRRLRCRSGRASAHLRALRQSGSRRGPARTAESGSGLRSSTRSRRRTAEAARCEAPANGTTFSLRLPGFSARARPGCRSRRSLV